MLAGKFQVITFEELIAIALDAPRVVGIYREIENPVFINEHVSFFSIPSFFLLFLVSYCNDQFSLKNLLAAFIKSNIIMKKYRFNLIQAIISRFSISSIF